MDTLVQTATVQVVTNVDTSHNVVTAPESVSYITNTLTNTILVESDQSTTVLAGQLGPRGQAGISEDDIMYSKRIDFITDNELYRGEAVVGSSESATVWRIRKITIISDDITELWAGGTSQFDKTWVDRLTYIYS